MWDSVTFIDLRRLDIGLCTWADHEDSCRCWASFWCCGLLAMFCVLSLVDLYYFLDMYDMLLWMCWDYGCEICVKFNVNDLKTWHNDLKMILWMSDDIMKCSETVLWSDENYTGFVNFFIFLFTGDTLSDFLQKLCLICKFNWSTMSTCISQTQVSCRLLPQCHSCPIGPWPKELSLYRTPCPFDQIVRARSTYNTLCWSSIYWKLGRVSLSTGTSSVFRNENHCGQQRNVEVKCEDDWRYSAWFLCH